jgi:hypothetical protein
MGRHRCNRVAIEVLAFVDHFDFRLHSDVRIVKGGRILSARQNIREHPRGARPRRPLRRSRSIHSGQRLPSITRGLVRLCASQGFGPEVPLLRGQRLCPEIGPRVCSRPWPRENVEAKMAVRILFLCQANSTHRQRRDCLALFAVFYSSCRLRS